MSALPEPQRHANQASVLRALAMAQLGGVFPKRIAVVGNAPLPVDAERAARIDGADAVVRMTTFATDADEPSIGRRTDIVFLHRATVAGPGTFRDYRRRMYLLAEPGRSYWEPEAMPAWWPADLGLVPVSNREFTKPLRKALRLAGADVSWPTTGTLAVHLMHELFPHADLFLTGTSLHRPPTAGGRSGEPRFEHHWGAAVPVTPEHRIKAERQLLGRWAAEGWFEVVE